jgi:VIT1/CCC1 family predicted Fe2+/Mn2+ transporter
MPLDDKMSLANSHSPTARELEAHRKLHDGGSRLSDIILGGQDGMVNILGLVLGVAAASGSPRIIIAAALSTTFAESLSMAAVSYTSTQADRDFYKGQVEREKDHIQRFTDIEREEIRRIYQLKGFSGKQLEDIVGTITSDVNRWVEVMLAEELKISPVEKGGVLMAAGIVGIAAIVGSLIPVIPFFGLPLSVAMWSSIALAGCSLFALGAYKAKVTVGVWWKSGLQLLAIGVVTAFFGYAIGATVAKL